MRLQQTHAIHIERLSLWRTIDTTECLYARDLGEGISIGVASGFAGAAYIRLHHHVDDSLARECDGELHEVP